MKWRAFFLTLVGAVLSQSSTSGLQAGQRGIVADTSSRSGPPTTTGLQRWSLTPSCGPLSDFDHRTLEKLLATPIGDIAADKPNDDLIVRAVCHDRLALVKRLLQAGVSPNARTLPSADPLLVIAVRNADLAMVRLLLKHGAQVPAERYEGPQRIDTAIQQASEPKRALLEPYESAEVESASSEALNMTGSPSSKYAFSLGTGLDRFIGTYRSFGVSYGKGPPGRIGSSLGLLFNVRAANRGTSVSALLFLNEYGMSEPLLAPAKGWTLGVTVWKIDAPDAPFQLAPKSHDSALYVGPDHSLVYGGVGFHFGLGVRLRSGGQPDMGLIRATWGLGIGF